MTSESIQRRLAAILAADVVGYSRLMEADEVGTLAQLKSRQKEVLTPLVAKHKGRLFKVTGDGVLVEFASAVAAVQCAIELQQKFAQANETTPEDRHIVLRIGINLGDVMVEGGDLYGDGVNIAARLEGLAEPGGILVSGSAQEQVRNKVPVEFDDMGSRNLKNISSPVRAYRVSLSQKVSAPPLALPDKPSIAVLPFTNMSGDPEQEYFSDGITEDIITALTHFRSLFVIARNSSFSYKGRSVKVQDIGRDLGVAYIVEGSVRKAGSRVRVTAQLIEAQSGNHIWANKLDRELADIFDVQDELVRAIASAVPGRVAEADLERSHRKPSESLTAYDYLLRGEWLLLEDYGSEEGARFFEKAIEIDPRCARAYCRLATYHAYRMFGQGAFDEHTLRLTPSLANKALEIDPGDAFVQSIAAQGFGMLGHHELASSHFDRAVALNPNEATVMRNAPQVLSYLGRTEESLDWMVRYMRADPHYGGVAREAIFDCLYLAKRFEDAIAMFQGWREPPAHMFCELAAAYSHLGRMEEAKTAVTEFERRKPAGFDFGVYKNAQIRMCARAQEAELWREGYRKAGLL